MVIAGVVMAACRRYLVKPRRLRTGARDHYAIITIAVVMFSGIALEALVAEDCDRCGNCVISCPQVDTTIKHYVVNAHLVEGMAHLLEKAASDEQLYFDLLLMAD